MENRRAGRVLRAYILSGGGSPVARGVRLIPVIAGTVVIVLGVLVLVGWALGSRLLTSLAPGLPSMKANTAAALICAGGAVLCLRSGAQATRPLGRGLALLVAGFGVVVIAEYALGGVGIDQALFGDPAGAYPGRTSPHTALALITLGFALATVDARGRWRRVHRVLLALAATVVLFAAVGFVYGVDYLRGGSGVSGVAVHTLLALLLLTVAVACLRPGDGIAKWVQVDDAGARMARVLLPVAVVAPLLLGGLGFEAQQAGWIGLRVGFSVYTLSMIFALAVLVAMVARRLRGADLELRRVAAIVDASDDAMINKTIGGQILSWNRAAERMYGYSAAEAVGRPVAILAPPDRQAEMPALLERLRQGEVQRVETERVHRDGTRLDVALTVSPIRDETGRVIGASTTARDITAGQEAKRRLERLTSVLAEAEAIAGLGSWDRDVQDGSTTWTDQVYVILGVDPEQHLPADIGALREMVHPDDREQCVATVAAVLATGIPGQDVYRIRRPDGEERILESWVRLAVQDGRQKLVGTVMDITETRRLQDEVTAARDLFAGVLDAATETAIIATDARGLITVFNRGAEKMLGRRAQDMIGRQTPAVLQDAEDLAARATELGIEPSLEVFAHAARAGRSETREWSVVHTDGHRLTASLTVTAVRGKTGEVTGFIGLARDVTEIREAEAARRQAEQIFEAAFAHAPTGVAITGMRGADRGIYLHTNEASARLVGRETGELEGMSFAELTHPDDLDETVEAFARVENMETTHTDKRYVHRDGSAVSVLVSTTPIVDESDGQPLYCVSQMLDVSELKRSAADLRASREHALKASRLKSEFVANMSHEIRTPLNGVVCMSELMLDTTLTDEQREYANVALTSAEALMGVVNDILDFSKIEAGKLEILDEEFSIETVAADVCEILGMKADEKGVELAVSLAPGVPAVVRGDGNRVRQMLINLVGNAIKFTPTGEIVVRAGVLRTGDRREFVRIEVADTGIGIDPDRMAVLFEPFAQADGTTTRRYGGTGLGLSITKQLAELMGGEIGVQSVPGTGSTFWFTLPCVRASGRQSDVQVRDLTGTRVLVVDDNASNRQIVQRQLASWGMIPDSAVDGRSALELMHRAADTGRPHEAVLIDMRMPEMDGLQLARTITDTPRLRGARLILLSGAHVPLRDAQAAGIDAVLTKPVRQSTLCDQLVNSLSRAPQSPQRKSPPEPPPASIGNGGRVLVAEDNEINQIAASRLLQKLGFSVDIARNGREAIEASGRVDYAAVFMDCQMPDVDGYTATKVIRHREGTRTHTPVIAMTAHAMEGDREKCLAAGMDDYIPKPLRSANLESVLVRFFSAKP